MTRERIAIGGTPEAGVEVDLWGHGYTTRPITRSVQQAVNDIKGKIAELADDDNDAAISWLADMVGVLLVPDGDDAPAAADLLREKWAADELTLLQLDTLADQVWEASKSPS